MYSRYAPFCPSMSILPWGGTKFISVLLLIAGRTWTVQFSGSASAMYCRSLTSLWMIWQWLHYHALYFIFDIALHIKLMTLLSPWTQWLPTCMHSIYLYWTKLQIYKWVELQLLYHACNYSTYLTRIVLLWSSNMIVWNKQLTDADCH